jgi:hypothetical protein
MLPGRVEVALVGEDPVGVADRRRCAMRGIDRDVVPHPGLERDLVPRDAKGSIVTGVDEVVGAVRVVEPLTGADLAAPDASGSRIEDAPAPPAVVAVA